jgi:hypothetical protein
MRANGKGWFANCEGFALFRDGAAFADDGLPPADDAVNPHRASEAGETARVPLHFRGPIKHPEYETEPMARSAGHIEAGPLQGTEAAVILTPITFSLRHSTGLLQSADRALFYEPFMTVWTKCMNMVGDLLVCLHIVFRGSVQPQVSAVRTEVRG